MIEFSEWIAEIGLRASRAGGVSLALRGAGFDFRWLTDAVRHGIAALRPAAVTVIFALIAVLGLASDSATFALEASRAAIADGQWWRLATGHVTHWSANHLFWDLLMFVALGATLECRNRRRFVALLAASAATI
jgi:membrane associated rhomboid family serine protease